MAVDEPEFFLSTDEGRDPAIWIGVPQVWPVPGLEETCPNIPTWAAAMTQAVWDDSDLESTPGDLDLLTRILAHIAEHYPGMYPGCNVFVHLREPTDMPLAVHIGDLETGELTAEEAEAGVRRIVAEHPNAVEEPIVEEFASPHLGAGIRAMCYIPDKEDGSINVGLRYGWYVPQLKRQAHLLTFALDPGHLHSALDDIDELARSMRYVRL